MFERFANKFALAIGLFLLSHSSSLMAYDVPTHQQYLTVEAAKLINSVSSNTYTEIFAFSGVMAQGTANEDQSINSLHHFFRPTDLQGLSVAGVTFQSAPQWLAQENYWPIAIADYQAGEKSAAYEQLGHVIHLAAQDMYAIQHAYSNAHLTLDFLDFSPNGYETWVKNNFNSIGLNTLHTGIFVPTFTNDPTVTLAQAATVTYKAARIPGTLVKNILMPAQGAIGAMFSSQSSEPIALTYQCSNFDPLSNVCSQVEAVWNIPNVGDCHELSGLIGSPSYPQDDWWKTSNFLNETGSYFYIDDAAAATPVVYKDLSPATGNLAKMYALDKERLLARSQEYSAGLMKQFAKIELTGVRLEI